MQMGALSSVRPVASLRCNPVHRLTPRQEPFLNANSAHLASRQFSQGITTCAAASDSASNEDAGSSGRGKQDSTSKSKSSLPKFGDLISPTSSQKMEKKWAELRLKKNQSRGYFSRQFARSPVGKAMAGARAKIWEAMLPLRTIFYHIHVVAYNMASHYNAYCLREAKVEWKLRNYYRKEKAWWGQTLLYMRDMFLTSFYLLLSPANIGFAVVIPTLWAALMDDKFWQSATFVTMLLFLPLKFPIWKGIYIVA